MKKSRFSEEQIVGILREGEKPDRTVIEVCRQFGISEHTYYRWRHRFGAMEVADVRRLRELEGENARLKRLVAERDLAGCGRMGSASDLGDRGASMG